MDLYKVLLKQGAIERRLLYLHKVDFNYNSTS